LAMAPTRIEWLQRVPVFGGLREESLRFLLELTRSVQVPRGEFFFREGDPASAMFVLESGAAAVVKGATEHSVELRRFEAGDCFGEMALMDLFPRSASVRALSDCAAIELGPADLHRLYELDPSQFALIQMNIGREVCRRLRAADELLFQARLREATPPPSR